MSKEYHLLELVIYSGLHGMGKMFYFKLRINHCILEYGSNSTPQNPNLESFCCFRVWMKQNLKRQETLPISISDSQSGNFLMAHLPLIFPAPSFSPQHLWYSSMAYSIPLTCQPSISLAFFLLPSSVKQLCLYQNSPFVYLAWNKATSILWCGHRHPNPAVLHTEQFAHETTCARNVLHISSSCYTAWTVKHFTYITSAILN